MEKTLLYPFMQNFNPNLYDILGRIPRHATLKDIKTAYRELAKHYHPDKNPHDPVGAAEKMTSLNEAYEILSNPKKREEYNEMLRKHDENLRRQEEAKRQRHEEERKRREAAERSRKAAEQAQRNAKTHTASEKLKRNQNEDAIAGLAGVALATVALGLLFAALSDED